MSTCCSICCGNSQLVHASSVVARRSFLVIFQYLTHRTCAANHRHPSAASTSPTAAGCLYDSSRSWAAFPPRLQCYVLRHETWTEGTSLFMCTTERRCLCRSFVTTELVGTASLRMNQRGHWVYWMSTSRKNGLMLTHTTSAYYHQKGPVDKQTE